MSVTLIQTESNKKTLGCQGIPKGHRMRAKYLLVCLPKNSREKNIATEMLEAIKMCNSLGN